MMFNFIKKRLFISFIIVTMLVSLLPYSSVMAVNDINFIWTEDTSAEDYYGFSTINGSNGTINDTEKGKNVLTLGNGAQAVKKFGDNIYYDSPHKLIEFDIKAMSDKTTLVLREEGYTEKGIQEDWMRWGGLFRLDMPQKKMGVCRFIRTEFADGYEDDVIPAEKLRWYNIKIVIDMKYCMAMLYVDDEFVEERALVGNLDTHKLWPLAGFDMLVSGGSVALDNMSVKDIDYNKGLELSEKLERLPEYMYQPFLFDDELGLLGNIYGDKDTQHMKLKAKGNGGGAYKGTLNFTAVSELTGEEYWKGSMPFDFDGNSMDLELDAHTGYYGCMVLKIEAVDENGNVVQKQDITYSVNNFPPDGVKNKMCGFTFHHSNSHISDIEDQLYLFDLLGAGTIRTDFWPELSWSNKQKKLLHNTEELLNYCEKYGLDVMATVQQYPADGRDFTSEQKDWVKNMSLALKDYPCVKAFELENEPDNGIGIVQYMKNAKELSDILRANRPEIELCGFAVMAGGTPFIIDGLNRGAAEFVDSVSFHPYTTPNYPELGGLQETFAQVKEAINKAGIEKCYVTEYGCYTVHRNVNGFTSSKITPLYQANMDIRGLLQGANSGIVGFMGTYVFTDYIAGVYDYTAEYESHCGILKALRQEDVSRGAKPAYTAFANYNTIMTDAKYQEEIKCLDDTTTVGYKYLLRDGRDCAILYNSEGTVGNEDRGIAAFKIDAPSLTAIDLWGNETEYYPVDGVYTFMLDDSPMYVTGDFSEIEQVKPRMIFDNTKLQIVSNDNTTLTLKNNTKVNPKITLAYTAGIKADVNVSDKEKKTEIKISDMTGKPAGNVFITLTDGDNVIFKGMFPVSEIEIISTNYITSPYKNNTLKWQAKWEITNNCSDKNISGDVIINSPSELAEKVGKLTLKTIKPGESGSVAFFLPEKLTSGRSVYVNAELHLEDGSIVPLSGESDCHFMKYAKEKPVCDGEISQGEYDNAMPVRINKAEQMVKLIPAASWWSGVSDMNAVAYPLWDEEYFYLAVEVEDNVQATNIANTLWASDSIQFGICDNKTMTNYTEGALGLIGNKEEFVFYRRLSGQSTSDVEDCEAKVSRKGNKTVYELKMPWNKLLEDATKIKVNGSIAFSYLVNDNDGPLETGNAMTNGRSGYGEYYIEDGQGGIGTAKNPRLFKTFLLIK